MASHELKVVFCDLDLEWRLIARAEPERARLVQSDIDWMVAHH